MDTQIIALGGGQIKDNRRIVSSPMDETPYSFIGHRIVVHKGPWSTWQTDLTTDWSAPDWSSKPNRTISAEVTT